MNPDAARLFIAIPLPAALEPALRAVQSVRSSLIRWTPPGHVHLTLIFLGAVERTAIATLTAGLCRACTGTAPLHLELDRLGAFPSLAQPKIVWCGLAGDIEPLAALQARIMSEVASFVEKPEARPFHPHLTLGRSKARSPRDLRALGRELEKLPDRFAGAWTTASAELIESRLTPSGPIYTRIASAPLD